MRDLGNLRGLGVLTLGSFELPFTVVAIVALINALNTAPEPLTFAGFCSVSVAGLLLVRLARRLVQAPPG